MLYHILCFIRCRPRLATAGSRCGLAGVCRWRRGLSDVASAGKVSQYPRRHPSVSASLNLCGAARRWTDGRAGRGARSIRVKEHRSHRSRLLAPRHGRAGRGARSCPSVARSKEPARIRGRRGTSATSRSARGDDAPHGRAARRSSRFEAAAELRVSLLGDMPHGPRCAPPRRRLAGLLGGG